MHRNVIIETFGSDYFSDAEMRLIAESETGATAGISQSAVMANLIGAKATRELTRSNRELALSNDSNTRAMIRLTRWLVVIAALQMIASFLSIF